ADASHEAEPFVLETCLADESSSQSGPSLDVALPLQRLAAPEKCHRRMRHRLLRNKNPRREPGRWIMIACASLGDLEILRGALAAVFHKVVFHDLVFVEGRKSRALDGRDMDEYVLIADGRLDEPVTLGRVEPLDGALLHRLSPSFLDVGFQT